MNLKFVAHKHINQLRWDKNLALAKNQRIYAQSWFLNAATNHKWDAVISDDYSILFPLPYNRKLGGLKQVYIPVLTQQLGVFGNNLTAEIINEALQCAQKKYIKFRYKFNEANAQLPLPFPIKQKVNMLLDLTPSSEILENNFSKSLRQKIKKAATNCTLATTDNIEELCEFYFQENAKKFTLSHREKSKITTVLKEAKKRNKCEIITALNTDNQMIAFSFYFIDAQRIYNSFGASNAAGRKLNARHLIHATTLLKHANQPLTFDFEGSEIPGVASFFKSFGPTKVAYALFVK